MNDKRRSGQPDWTPEWTKDRSFEEGPVVVTVHRSNHRQTRYRIEVFFQGPNGLVRSLSPRIERSNGKVTTEKVGDVLRRLFSEAEEYVHALLQEAEDAWIERQIDSGKRDGGKAPKGLKTLAKMDKEKALAKKNAENSGPSQ